MKNRMRLVIAETIAVLCAATALWPVYDSDGWILPVALVIVVVMAGGELLRRVGMPRVLVPFGSLAVLLIWLVATRARDVAPLGLLPSPASMTRLTDLLSSGFDDVQNDAAPVPTSPGLLLLAVGGLGLTAVVVDVVAVTLRRPALAGLPLLIVYAVPGSVAPSGVPWLAFVLGAAGYLGLLLAESRDRVGRWGRLLGANRTRVVSNPLSVVGRRVGGTALAVAVLVPALVPGLDGQVLRIGDGGDGSGTGTGRIGASANPLVNLTRDLGRRDQVKLFTMDVPLPPGGPQQIDPDPAPYMRTTVYTTFTGTTWTHTQAIDNGRSRDGALAPGWNSTPAGEPRPVDVSTTKQARVKYLPTPYGATTVSSLDGDWFKSNDSHEIVALGKTNAADMDYTVRQVEPRIDATKLLEVKNVNRGRELVDTHGLGDLPDVQGAIKEAVGDEGRPFGQALLLQSYLSDRDRFSYDPTAPESTDQKSLLESFLEQKRGFCVHYATAMVLMARELGIPARFAVGYLPGRGESAGGKTRYTVTSLESHAWPELYFEGYGWLRFEPTPRTDVAPQKPSYAEADSPAELTASAVATPTTTATTSPSASASAKSDERPDKETIAPAAGAASGGSGGSHTPLLTAGAVVLVLALALAPALARRRLRSRRLRVGGTSAGVVAAWDEVCDVAIDVGLGRLVGAQTPRQYAAALVRTTGMRLEEASPLSTLLQAYERARFADPAAALPEVGMQAREVSAALVSGSDSTDRFRARWIPRSTWAGLRSGVTGLAVSTSRTMGTAAAKLSLRSLRPRRG